MTASPPVIRQQDPIETTVEGQEEPRCVACSHELANHDAIGLRYCQATQAQALPRNCICRDR
jgi:hypothetical protein